MRMMLKAAMCTEKANAAVRDGTLGKTIQGILEQIKPEAAYFSDADGKRTAYLICNITEAAQIPALAEPWFLALNAAVEMHAVMVPEDLAKAGPALDQAGKKYPR